VTHSPRHEKDLIDTWFFLRTTHAHKRDLKQLLERIHLRLDESMVGIGAQVAHLAAADLAELLNELTLAEAATVVSMLPGLIIYFTIAKLIMHL
jgi:hypothetical protein